MKESYFLVQHKKLLSTLKYLSFYCAPVNLKCYVLKKRCNILQKNFYQKQYPEAKRLLKSFYKFKSINQFFKNHLKLKFEQNYSWLVINFLDLFILESKPIAKIYRNNAIPVSDEYEPIDAKWFHPKKCNG